MLKRAGPHPEIPGQTRQVFPTQDITDLEVIEEIDCRPEDYQPVAIETPHPQSGADPAYAGLILIAQGLSRIQSDPPKMERVYMTLPGAWVISSRLDPDGGVVTIKTRKNLSRLITSSETLTDVALDVGSFQLWTKTTNGQGGDAVVGDEIVESRGLPGNAVPSATIESDDQVATISSTLKKASNISPSATHSAGVITSVSEEPVSDLVSKEIVKRKAFLDEAIYRVTIPNIIPERFRAAVSTSSVTHVVAGTASTPTLGAGELERVEAQLTKLLKRVTVETLGSVGTVTLSDTAIDKQGLFTTVVFTFAAGEQTLNPFNLGNFSDGQITHLGSGYTLKTEIFDTLPSPWRTSKRQDVDGATLTVAKRKNLISSITVAETLSSGVWTRTSQEEENGTIATEVVTTRAIPGDPLTSQPISKDGDVTTETRTLFAAAGFTATSVIVGSTWTRTFSEKLEGTDLVIWKVVEVRTTQNTLGHYIAEIPERSIPPKLRSALPTTTSETTEKGTASLPTLSTGDFFRSEQQLDQYTYRKKIVNLVLSGTITVTDKGITERFGGGPTTLTYTLSATIGTVDEGLLVISSKIDILGNGLYLKTTEARDGAAWSTLSGGEFDETLQAVVPFTTQTVAAGGTGGVSGDVVTEVKPIDYERSQQIIRSLPTSTIDNYSRVLHNTCNVDLPSELTSVSSYMNKNHEDGSYSEGGTYGLGGNGSGGVDMHGSSQGSAAIAPEAAPVIKTYYGVGKPCFHVLFFVANGTSRADIRTRLGTLLGASVSEWPAFAPKPVSIICKGSQTSSRILASVKAHSNTRLNYKGEVQSTGEARSNGFGYSYDIAVNAKIIHIPPTIHAGLTVGGDGGSDTQAYAASISLDTGGGGGGATFASTTGNVNGSVANVESGSTSIAATPGTQTMPTSGLYLTPRGLISEPANKYDRTRVLAEVVDFANIR